MRRLLLYLLVLGAAGLAACSAAGAPLAEEPTDDPDQPVSSDDPVEPTAVPTARTGEWIYAEATVDSLDLLMLESFPLQIRAVINGVLGDACTELDDITVEREGDTFKITVMTARPAGEACDQVARTFEETVPLNVVGLPAGTYTVEANNVTRTFTLDVDNILEPPTLEPTSLSDDGGFVTLEPIGVEPQFQPTKPGDTESVPAGNMQRGLAPITAVNVIPQSMPPSAEVIFRGWLSTPCVQISNITEQIQGSTIYLTVETEEPLDVICTQVIQEFEQHYFLQNLPGRGTYTVIVNDVAAQFTIP